MPQWSTVDANMRCFVTSASSNAFVRVTPTIEQGTFLTIFVSPDTEIKYNSRIKNIKLKNKTMFSGVYEVQDIKKMLGFSGKMQFQEILIREVVE